MSNVHGEAMTVETVDEFGHIFARGPSACIDSWGVGPFVIATEGRSYRFIDSDRFGPHLATRKGHPLANPWPPERSPFWRAHRIWVRQGRRTEDGVNCIWDEPKPQILCRLNRRNAMLVEAGEEDGKTIWLTEGEQGMLGDVKR
jgi:hypothetical protein